MILRHRGHGVKAGPVPNGRIVHIQARSASEWINAACFVYDVNRKTRRAHKVSQRRLTELEKSNEDQIEMAARRYRTILRAICDLRSVDFKMDCSPEITSLCDDPNRPHRNKGCRPSTHREGNSNRCDSVDRIHIGGALA